MMTDTPPRLDHPRLPALSNPPLLMFLALALRAEGKPQSLAQVAGIGGCDLAMFRAVAVEAGYLDGDDRLTPAGLAYAREQLHTLSPLFFASVGAAA